MKIRLFVSATLLNGLLFAIASAQLVPYSTDFTNDTTGLGKYPTNDLCFIGDDWQFFATQGGVGPYFGAAPNSPNCAPGDQISAMASFDGNQYINVFADYQNALLPNAANPPGFTVSVFQERTFTPADAASGDTWTFSFFWKHADSGAPSGSTTAGAFIRVFDGAFNILAEENFDTTTVNASFPGFDPATISVTMDPGWVTGGILQFGFTNTAGGWGPPAVPADGSGVFYDNVNFTNVPVSPSTPLAPFCSDFEDLVPGAVYTPIGDGWLFFHTNVPTLPETSYGGDAPQGPQISNLADADGDPGKSLGQTNTMGNPIDPAGGGNKYLNIYNDYNNSLHASGTPLTNRVYQERSFTGADAALGETWTFSFDYAGAEAPFFPGASGSSTTAAYIRVFDGAFNILAEETFDTTSATSLVFAPGSVSITFDPGWIAGGLVQFGFTSTATNYEPSGIYYDNVDFANFVRGDANDDGVINNLDINAFALALFSPPTYEAMFPGVDPNVVLDVNCDGAFNNLDIAAFGSLLGF